MRRALVIGSLLLAVGFAAVLIQDGDWTEASAQVEDEVVALATVSCGGFTYTVRTCTDTGASWFTAYFPKTHLVFKAKCELVTCPPFTPCGHWAIPRPPHANDNIAGNNQKLYCGTDGTHDTAVWSRAP